MSGDAHTTYWTTVAQIIPVLILALALEAREVSRRWTVDSSFGATFGYAVSWVIAYLSLMGCMVAALITILGDAPLWLTSNFDPLTVNLMIVYALIVLGWPPVAWAYRAAVYRPASRSGGVES